MNIKLVLEYDGTRYHGYQIQANANTVQAELENVLRKLVIGEFVLYCAGRTDSGVHALGQVCNFVCDDIKVNPAELENALNGMLPDDISVREASVADDSFNARYSAKERVYRYVILNRKNRSSVHDRFSWHISKPLDLQCMKKAAEYLEGSHDFKAFTVATYPDATVRNVYNISIYNKDDFVIIDICANAFTRSMVRNIVGTLSEIGTGKRSAEEIKTILHSMDRQKAGICAPAKGLFLLRIKY